MAVNRSIVCSRARSLVRPTTGVLSPRKVVTKHTGTSSAGRVVQVAALSVVQVDSPMYSPQYSPASPSPPCYSVTGAKVGRGKVLTPPLDRSGVDSPPDTVRCHIKPPPIRGLPEIHAYTVTEDEDEDDEEGPIDIASLHEQLAALRLRLNNMDEHVTESKIDMMELGIGLIPFARPFVRRSNSLRRRLGTRISTDPRNQNRC